MQRDMDLVREILLAVEQHGYNGSTFALDLPNHTHPLVQYHLMLLDKAKLLIAKRVGQPTHFEPLRLTWAGYEFLETARDDSTWNKAKNAVLTKVGGLPFQVLSALLVEYGKRSVMLPGTLLPPNP